MSIWIVAHWPNFSELWIFSINWYAHIATSEYVIFLRIAFVDLFTMRKCLFIYFVEVSFAEGGAAYRQP